MAHIGLALMGVGDVLWQGRTWSAAEVLSQLNLQPIAPGAKEGLSLVNGTPCMTGLACLALDDAERLMNWADVTGAMSGALRGQLVAFDAEILALKASPGIQTSGQRLRELLAGSRLLAESEGLRTQDALSLRSMPQVHGACRDQFSHAQTQINIELNACTDNPLILGTLEQWRVVSQAHPHGESVAMACDLLAIAMAELGAIAERRLDRLVNPLVSGLPAFLVARPGVNSGMMIAQYVAASLCAENKQLAQPAVLDNFVTSALQEDHLSLGTSAALKLQRLLGNLYQILGIEYLLAAQGSIFTSRRRWRRVHVGRAICCAKACLAGRRIAGWRQTSPAQWLSSSGTLATRRHDVTSEVSETGLFPVFAPGVGGESFTEVAGDQASGQVVQR